MRKILSLIIVMRPHNIAVALLSVAVGFAMTGSTRWPWLVFAAAAFATAAGNTINDIYDVDIDRVNKPRRPLAAGALSVRGAIGLYAFFFAATVFLMPVLPGDAAVWIGVWIVLLHIYSWRLKRMCLVGNVLVSAVAGSGFLLGAHVGGNVAAGAVPAAFTFLFVMGREIVKDTDDIEGDRACGAKTFPIVAGRRAALATALAIFLALCFAFPVPAFVGMYGRAYALVMMLSVVPMLLVSIGIILKGRALGTVSALLKIGMFFGCLACYLGPRR
jgi:geranylgeranylglycerol-phosphate geranylgeranyltransferase